MRYETYKWIPHFLATFGAQQLFKVLEAPLEELSKFQLWNFWRNNKPVIIKKYITKTRLFKYIANFNTNKWKLSDENSSIFHISAQNIDCGYLLEPPRRGGSNEHRQSMF